MCIKCRRGICWWVCDGFGNIPKKIAKILNFNESSMSKTVFRVHTNSKTCFWGPKIDFIMVSEPMCAFCLLVQFSNGLNVDGAKEKVNFL